ncbi:MerR family transcriptional regulator [Metabacillus fastidiosus]|uniref:MerR family transcriptional regulator n=1 Tax=Metabacillus fastidiosus TaxID=1458 RepID=UPI003D2B8919
MNTTAVSKLLNVSPRTVMRWAKQLNLQLERNELGHYQFSEADITSLQNVKDQLAKGVLLQDITAEGQKKKRIGIVNNTEIQMDYNQHEFQERLDDLERTINGKADDVVSYQLLQHRKEMEELIKKIASLEEKVQNMEKEATKTEHKKEKVLIFDHPEQKTSFQPKRKNIISSIFGL